jgi:hypothetical protein
MWKNEEFNLDNEIKLKCMFKPFSFMENINFDLLFKGK